jgi:hypothetical protein
MWGLPDETEEKDAKPHEEGLKEVQELFLLN